MRHLIIVTSFLAVCGCQSVGTRRDNPALKSEREYAERSEARAQSLVRTGQASNISDARANAAAETNNEWAAAARAAERKATQAKFEKDLSEAIDARK